MTSIDPWFLYQLKEINDMQLELEKHPMESVPTEVIRDGKRMGFSDGRPRRHLAPKRQREIRKKFATSARSTASSRCTSAWTPAPPNSKASRRIFTRPTKTKTKPTPTAKKKVIILGSGPNRIGQGIEFDYCCCHASFALRDDGYETIMINCNPETVSTDYDTSDRSISNRSPSKTC
jgi:carbamoyl-phosphate synthase large subunit